MEAYIGKEATAKKGNLNAFFIVDEKKIYQNRPPLNFFTVKRGSPCIGKQSSQCCCQITTSPPVCTVKPCFLAGGMGSNVALFCCFRTVLSFPFVTLGVVIFSDNPEIIVSAVTVPCAVEFYFACYTIK